MLILDMSEEIEYIEEVAKIEPKKDIYGIVLDEKIYHHTGAKGSTMISTMIENPIKYEMIKKGLIKFESVAFENGTILHTKVLEPEKCDDVFLVSDLKASRKVNKILKNELEYEEIPNVFLTPSGAISKKKDVFESYQNFCDENMDKVLISSSEKKDLQFFEENKDKIIITKERSEAIEVAINNAEKYLPLFDKYLRGKNGYSERSFFAILYFNKDTEDIPLTLKQVQNIKEDDARLTNGVLCQCRPDRIYCDNLENPYIITVIDFKSTGKSATADDWVKSSAGFGYDVQEVHYTRVLKANGFEVEIFLFAYCSLLEYGGAGYKRHSKIDIEHAENLHNQALKKLYWCETNDVYSNQTFTGDKFTMLEEVALPIWRQYTTV